MNFKIKKEEKIYLGSRPEPLLLLPLCCMVVMAVFGHAAVAFRCVEVVDMSGSSNTCRYI
jgi:hypothetical protein